MNSSKLLPFLMGTRDHNNHTKNWQGPEETNIPPSYCRTVITFKSIRTCHTEHKSNPNSAPRYERNNLRSEKNTLLPYPWQNSLTNSVKMLTTRYLQQQYSWTSPRPSTRCGTMVFNTRFTNSTFLFKLPNSSTRF